MLLKRQQHFNIFKEIRHYLNMSQEKISRELGISTRTWIRWEKNPLIRTINKTILKKIIKLIEKKGKEEFLRNFLISVIYDKKIETFGKTNDEIIRYIDENYEEFQNSPILQKLFNEHPEWKKLSFNELVKRYCEPKISYNAIFILNSIPNRLTKILYEKKERPTKKLTLKKIPSSKNLQNKKIKKRKKESKNIKTRKNKGSTENSDNSEDDWIGIQEVSRLVGIKIKTIYKYASQGRIPGYNYNRHWKFKKEEILNWREKFKNTLFFENLVVKGTAPAPDFKKEGEMALYRRGKIWWIAKVINGNLIRISTGTSDRKEAERMLAQIIVENGLLAGDNGKNRYILGWEYPKRNEITLEEIIENFIERYVKSSKSEGYYKRCQLARRKLYEFFGKKVPAKGITKLKVLEYKLWRKNQLTRYGKPPSLSTLNAELRLLRAAWNKATEMGLINLPNPCCQRGLIEKEHNQRVRVITDEEELKILKFFKNHPEHEEMKIAFLLSRYAAASRGEIPTLKVKDIDLINKEITFFRNKNKKLRTIPIHPYLYEEVRKYLSKRSLTGDSQLLPNLTVSKITDTFKRITRKLGIKGLCFHDVRRRCIKDLSEIEPNLYVLKELTGHSGIDVLSHYIPVGDADKKRVMEEFGKRSFTITKPTNPKENGQDGRSC